MRLTLRTMLACLDADNRLDPADVEDLNQKIQHSKYASDLAARVRRLVQHPRVGTPRLDAKGSALDANSVAEYLDNTLPPEQIADFERQCIESDVRLAEAAACHQILVLVLEQPAEFEATVRDRMYRLGSETSRQSAEAAAATTSTHVSTGQQKVRIDRPAQTAATAAAPTTSPTPKPKPEVPDYLRAGRKPSLWPLALAALFAFAVVGIGLRMLGPLDETHPIAKTMASFMGKPSSEVAVLPDDKDNKQPTDDKTPAPPIAPESTNNNKTADPVEPPMEPMEPATVDPVEPKKPDPLEPKPPVTNPPVNSNTPVIPVDPPQPVFTDVGRFVSEDQLLIHANEAGDLVRVATRSPVYAGETLTSLPTYRPQVLLENNVQFTVAGDARIKLGTVHTSGAAQLALPFGRILAVSAGKANARLALDLGHAQGVATFTDGNAEVAIEVRSYLPPGANPETPGVTIPVARVYVTRGKIQWQDGTIDEPAGVTTIEAGQVRNYVGKQPGETFILGEMPDWIDGKNLSDIDRRAAHDMAAKLTPDRDLLLSLQELAAANERRSELRALAIRSLIVLDQYEACIPAFADDTQRAFWAIEYDLLRDAISRSPKAATTVHDLFVKIRGEESGEFLYRLLWGFSTEDLQTPIVDELVKSLDFEELDYRVLAFENLRRITGSTLLYQPQMNAARRKTPVAQWQRLKEINYKIPPAPIMDLKATPVPEKPAAPANPTNPLRDTEPPLP